MEHFGSPSSSTQNQPYHGALMVDVFSTTDGAIENSGQAATQQNTSAYLFLNPPADSHTPSARCHDGTTQPVTAREALNSIPGHLHNAGDNTRDWRSDTTESGESALPLAYRPFKVQLKFVKGIISAMIGREKTKQEDSKQLHQTIDEKDKHISELNSRLDSLEARLCEALEDKNKQRRQTHDEKEKRVMELVSKMNILEIRVSNCGG